MYKWVYMYTRTSVVFKHCPACVFPFEKGETQMHQVKSRDT